MNQRFYKHPCLSWISVLFCATVLSSCSSMSPEMRESMRDLRGSLPGALKGDATSPQDDPLPNLSGGWVDDNHPELNVSLSQSGSKVNVGRSGTRGGVVVKEKLNLELIGRSIKAKYIDNHPNLPRPKTGQCTGSVNKASDKISMTCTYGDNTFPLILKRA
ncbi:MAG: hypothetical protein KTR35_18040 [Gammaproteobacteria bacterium]|nr:hypothetical protein [Gammaproteobacteria bacterium]